MRSVKTAALSFLLGMVLCTCVYKDADAPPNNEDNFFWVVLDDKKTRNTYTVVRVALIDAEGAQLADSSGPFDGKYRVVPPLVIPPSPVTPPVETPPGETPPVETPPVEIPPAGPSAAEAPPEEPPPVEEAPQLNYLIELRTLTPQGKNIDLLAPNPLALGYLRSRYIEIRGQSVPKAGETVTLTLETDDLKVGYGSGGLPLSEIPGIPAFFKLELNLITDPDEMPNMARLLTQGYAPVLAVAIGMREETGEDPGIQVDTAKNPPVDQGSVLAIAAPDTGWFMLMPRAMPAGTPCRYWMFFTKGGDYSTIHLAYYVGQIPQEGSVLTVPVSFAGIPVPNTAALMLMAQPNSARAMTPYRDLSESFVLTGGNTSNAYDLNAAYAPWMPIGRDPSYTGVWGDNLPGRAFSAFSGWFDGGGYTIWDVRLEGAAITNYNGLFGYAENALFQNVKIQLSAPNALIVPDTPFTLPTANGFLAGYALDTVVKNTDVQGTTFSVTSQNSAGYNYAGGVIGSGANITYDATVTAGFLLIEVNGGSPSQWGTIIGGP